jgi:hypothetical protein
MPDIDLAQHLFSKADVRGPTECWEWQAARLPKGYGQFWMPHLKRMMGAHRAAWLLTAGDIPVGLEVCHSCDNRACVNPAHLWIGTHQENVTDCRVKGRGSDNLGTRNPRAALTEDGVREIRAFVAAGGTRAAMARRYGLSHGTICAVVDRRNWKHVI